MLGAMMLLLICVSMLFGCKKNTGTPEDNAIKEGNAEEEKVVYKFGFSAITMENPYFITLESAIRDTIEDAGHVLITKDPGLDQKTQNTQIQEMIDEGIDAIFVTPVDWIAITPSLEALKKADVKIINVDTQVKEMNYVDAYIGSDNRNAGYICGENLIKRCPEGGKIVILECPTMNSINDRITGFEEAILDHGFEVVARKDTKGDLETSLESATEIFASNQGIVAVMCGNDPTALGALVAANTVKLKDTLIYGVDGSPDLKKELQKPGTLIAGTGGQSPINMGKSAAKTGINILSGEEYEKEVLEETFFIDKENLEMYGVDGWQ